MKNLIKKPIETGLKENLNYMTVDFLKNIAKVYEIDKTYKMKKDELIQAIYDRLTDENYLISNLAAYYEHENHIRSVGNNTVPESIMTLGLAKIGMYFLYDLGDGNIKSIMPDEINEVYIKIDKNKIALVQETYSKIFNYMRAFANLYGIFEVEFFLDIYNKQNEDKLILKELMYYLDKYNIHNSSIINYEGMLVCEALCMYEGDIDKVLQEREGREYNVPSKEELLKYSSEYYFKNSRYYDDLEAYLLKNINNAENVESIICDIWIDYVMGTFDIGQIMSRLHMMGMVIENIKEAEKLLTLCTQFGNHIPKWINKGWSQGELMKEEKTGGSSSIQAASNKIGRNDPCPCGSGKKYKKCCAR